MRPHVSIERAQVRELLPLVAGHLVHERTFHVDDFIMRERKYEVLAPRVEQTKRQSVVVAAAKQWISLKIFERVVHPTHVPLKIKSQPARINRMTDGGPGSWCFGN